MGQPRSDNRLENHPKPVQNGERKLVGGVYVDYTDQADVVANNASAFMPNKYFWIQGVKYHVDNDGITFRVVGGAGSAGMKALKFAINADGSGVPDSTFDGYKAALPTLSDSRLENVRIVTVIMGGTAFQDFYVGGDNKIEYSSITGMGTIDFTNVAGSLSVGTYVIIIYQPQ